ncbi:MAG: hypothetical protein U0487_03335 [Patescibacteria group bacterium]
MERTYLELLSDAGFVRRGRQIGELLDVFTAKHEACFALLPVDEDVKTIFTKSVILLRSALHLCMDSYNRMHELDQRETASMMEPIKEGETLLTALRTGKKLLKELHDSVLENHKHANAVIEAAEKWLDVSEILAMHLLRLSYCGHGATALPLPIGHEQLLEVIGELHRACTELVEAFPDIENIEEIFDIGMERRLALPDTTPEEVHFMKAGCLGVVFVFVFVWVIGVLAFARQ